MRIERLIKKHNIKTNSKDIKKGDIFVCALGNYDKTKYIKDAKKKKCSRVITQNDINIDINLYLKELLDKKYNYPLEGKNLIGITGTDGKTTTASILRMMISGASIGTNGVEYLDKQIDIANTTPSLDYLYQYFNLINEKNIQNIIMEVSSESYLTKRIPNLMFDVGIFLNISKEHLDKHPSFNNYLECKKELLRNSKIKIVNRDLENFKYLINGLDNYYTFGFKKSDLRIIKYKLSFNNTQIWFKYAKKKYHIVSPLLGKYNVYSLVGAILCMLKLNYKMEDIINRINNIKKIPGRMEKLTFKGKKIMIDYAHTIKATRNILSFLKKYSKMKIITIVGCAGGRYREKRSLIGKYVLEYSQIVIFTSDDPRDENPVDIINEMIGKSNKKNYYIVPNRRDAIITGLSICRKNNLLLILGKGRDNYMAIKEDKIEYSDINVINDYVNSN